jgi:hypothetical protein
VSEAQVVNVAALSGEQLVDELVRQTRIARAERDAAFASLRSGEWHAGLMRLCLLDIAHDPATPPETKAYAEAVLAATGGFGANVSSKMDADRREQREQRVVAAFLRERP